MSVSTTHHIERCLQRLQCDDPTVRTELLEFAQRRLKSLAERMFVRFPMLQYHVEADDLLQEAMLRLWKSVERVGPATVSEFMGLAALQFRRSLHDLARKHYGRQKSLRSNAINSLVETPAGDWMLADRADDIQNAPEELMAWSEFHDAAGALPEPERTVFDLLYYHELPQIEVAALMQITDRHVRRLWQSARKQVILKVDGNWPEL